ncbi:uncharacterized protein K444DRAFT_617515 [Hyaloscypha bicolor E]|uniref:Uncharacterized protein n=1 Tax=Hyaloscypha bicolor E TaxID=1095630 RepID=A0A2J6SWP1_9HELO|nr:uncharacterized protein K444DRAFT_617515 [Hyaloscypha bicolor E]PMD55073.1 hypothetical protein K444DRAFT_617515 [Hyaloscypha bicolor E]
MAQSRTGACRIDGHDFVPGLRKSDTTLEQEPQSEGPKGKVHVQSTARNAEARRPITAPPI